jgi:hypothetical protein
MKSPSPPPAPDPYATAQAQTQFNSDAARLSTALNRPNQNTPYGSLKWHNDGDKWWSDVTLDPRVQQSVDSELATANGLNSTVQSALGRVQSAMGQPINYAGAPAGSTAQGAMQSANGQFTDVTPDLMATRGLARQGMGLQSYSMDRMGQMQGQALPGIPTADNASRQRVEDAMYGRATSRLDPQFQQQESSLRSDLMNRGIVEGSEAWKTQMDNLGRAKTDAYGAARDSAILAGGQEQSRMFDLGAQTYGMGMQGRQQQFGEAQAGMQAGGQAQGQLQGLYGVQGSQVAGRDASAAAQYSMGNMDRDRYLSEQERRRALVMNELNALRTGSQVAQPTFQNGNIGANVQPANFQGAANTAYQGAMNGYNAQVGSQNSLMGGLFGLGAAAMGAPAGGFLSGLFK